MASLSPPGITVPDRRRSVRSQKRILPAVDPDLERFHNHNATLILIAEKDMLQFFLFEDSN